MSTTSDAGRGHTNAPQSLHRSDASAPLFSQAKTTGLGFWYALYPHRTPLRGIGAAAAPRLPHKAPILTAAWLFCLLLCRTGADAPDKTSKLPLRVGLRSLTRAWGAERPLYGGGAASGASSSSALLILQGVPAHVLY